MPSKALFDVLFVSTTTSKALEYQHLEIINFLINSYYLIYPDYVFNWTMMVETMGRCDTPKENIESLLCAKQMHFLEQPYAT